MQELINRTNDVAESLFSTATDAAYLASYLGLSYLTMSVLTSLFARFLPQPARSGVAPK